MQGNNDEVQYEDRNYRAKRTIERYISNEMFKSSDSYNAYEYFPLVLMKHPEVKKLQSYFERKKRIEFNKRDLKDQYEDSLNHINTLIQNQKDSIRINNWTSKYKMDHLFAITTAKNVKTIYEIRFFMNYALDSVTKVEMIMRAEEPKEMRGVFYHFFSEMDLSGTVDDEEFYEYYKAHLSSLESPIERGLFLEHCMEITAVAASKNSVDVNLLSQGMIQSFVKQDTLFKSTDITRFGPLYATTDSTGKASNEDPELIKYDRNVLFMVYNDSTKIRDSLPLQFEFDPYLKVKDIYTLPPPYHQYFEK